MFRNGMMRSLLIGGIMAGLFQMMRRRRNRAMMPNRLMGQMGRMFNQFNLAGLMRNRRRMMRPFAR
ncbi:MAG: hypothetical protein H0Z33_16480 [Bacillaceae bacterium]|nr:hypothetical protein [Bacillaceae bacterium]